MTRSRWQLAAVAALLALICTAVVRWRGAVEVVSPGAASTASVAPVQADSLEDALATAEQWIVSNDPFRLSNAPPSVRYDPSEGLASIGSGVALPAPLRPAMTLKAIVGGPPWQAVVDGLPGQPANTVVRAGSAYDKLVARSVTRDSVVIQGPDTTWVLTFRRPE